jgi:hypothetical protein
MIQAIEYTSAADMRRNAALIRSRMWGKQVKPAPRVARPECDASYHVTLYRAYRENLIAGLVVSKSYAATGATEYCPYSSELKLNITLPPKTMRDIAMEVLARFPGVTLADIQGSRRTKLFTFPRHVAMYEIARQMPHKSYPEIGRFFGGKDHTSVLHSVRKMKAKYENDSDSEAWMARKRRRHHKEAAE